MIEIVEPLGVA